MAVQAIKGVEIGLGFEAARRRGSQVHDPIHYDPAHADSPNLGYTRPTNNAGGLEAGMTNGQPLVVRAAKKPISTLRKPLDSVNLETKAAEAADYERSDVCAVSAASVIVENVVAFEVAAALVEKFGGDSLVEMKARYELVSENGPRALGSFHASDVDAVHWSVTEDSHGTNARTDSSLHLLRGVSPALRGADGDHRTLEHRAQSAEPCSNRNIVAARIAGPGSHRRPAHPPAARRDLV